MQIKILSSLWGYEHFPLKDILQKIKRAGYDGIDTFMPDDENVKRELLQLIKEQELCLVVQQHQANGDTFPDFKSSFAHYLELSASVEPLLINSHTGKDYFSFEQNMELIDMAQSFSRERGIEIVHETHRGRFGFSPLVIRRYFDALPDLRIAADFSHWTCVTESFLEGFKDTLQQAFARTTHIHARVGYEEGPQVPDPRAPEWKQALDKFLNWWDQIVDIQLKQGRNVLTITTEFGPVPYMPTLPFSNKPVADLFEINGYMKDLLRNRYT
jgi:sugar phosphate isomerase/epimerase